MTDYSYLYDILKVDTIHIIISLHNCYVRIGELFLLGEIVNYPNKKISALKMYVQVTFISFTHVMCSV